MSTDQENPKNGDMEVEEASSEETPGSPESKPPADSKESEDSPGKIKDKDAIKQKTKGKETKKEIKDEDNDDEKIGKEEKEGSESEDEEDDDDDDEDENENDDGKVPLLDQPLELSGTRERKKVQRFTEEYKTEAKDSTPVEIPEGRGTPLGNITKIEANIQRSKAGELKPLHKVLFSRVGKSTLVKKYVRKFNGFDFDEKSEQYAKKKQVILKLESKVLKGICSILDLKKSSKREELAEQVLKFLMKPEGSEKPVKQTQRKRGSRVNKSYSESEEEERRPQPRRGKMKRVNLKEISSDEEDLDDKDEKDSEEENDKGPKKERKRKDSDKDEVEDAEDEDNDDGASSDGSEDPKSKRGRGSKSTKKNNKTIKKASSKKTPAKKTEKKSTKKRAKSDDESSEDDEPLVKKAKAPPTDEEIKNYVKQILEGANLEETTMKIVCRQVYAHYPDFDLAHKKDFIKTTVKSLISP